MKKNIVILVLLFIVFNFSACKGNLSIAKNNDYSEKSEVVSNVQSTEITIKETQTNNKTDDNKSSDNTLNNTTEIKDAKNNTTKSHNKTEKKLVDVYVDINGVHSSINDFKRIDEQIELIEKESAETNVVMTSKIGTVFKVYSDKSEEAIIEVFIGSDNCYYMKTTRQETEYFKIEPSKDKNIFDIIAN